MPGHSLRPSDLPERGRPGATDSATRQDTSSGKSGASSWGGLSEGPIHLGPLLVWLLIQLAALMLAAFRVPLAAQYPQPAEFQAVRLMLAAQFVALALLHPWLLRTWATALAVLCTGWVMLNLAALLSAWTLTDVLPVGIFLSIWTVDFALLGRIRRPRWQLAITAIASAYVIGGPLLWYLQLEFASPARSVPSLAFGPLLLALSTPRHLPPPAWIEAAAIGFLMVLLRKFLSTIAQNTN